MRRMRLFVSGLSNKFLQQFIPSMTQHILKTFYLIDDSSQGILTEGEDQYG
jgi:hypothetical protein